MILLPSHSNQTNLQPKPQNQPKAIAIDKLQPSNIWMPEGIIGDLKTKPKGNIKEVIGGFLTRPTHSRPIRTNCRIKLLSHDS